MQCKYHPDRKAEQFCSTCYAPLCSECAEEVRPGVYTCFQCAMVREVSEGGSRLKEKRSRDSHKKRKRPWGPFQYFLVVSSVLILVMWGVILFGGHPAPASKVSLAKGGRVLLFMVDGALKRYAHYEGNRYPDSLADLVPKYLAFKQNELGFLDQLVYRKDPVKGYKLSLRHVKKGEMNLVLTAKGIEYRMTIGGRPK